MRIQAKVSGLGYFWMGLNDRETEGTFVWPSGEAFTYDEWGTFEPNDYNYSEDCVFSLLDGIWFDAFCLGHAPFVCEKDFISSFS